MLMKNGRQKINQIDDNDTKTLYYDMMRCYVVDVWQCTESEQSSATQELQGEARDHDVW